MIANAWRKYTARKTRIGIVIDFAFLLALVCVTVAPIRRGIVTYVLRCTLAQPARYDKVIYLSEADNFVAKTLDGNDTLIAFPPTKNRLVNIGNIWSAQTRAELRSLNIFAEKFAETTEVLFIATDDPQETRRYLRRKGYSSIRPLYIDLPEETEMTDDDSSDLLHEMRMSEPASLLIDTGGEVWVKRTGAAKWTGSKIDKLMDEIEQDRLKNN